MKTKRRFFTLIEMVIALGLGLMLIVALLGIYQLLEIQIAKQRDLRIALFEERHLYHRLNTAFLNAEYEKKGKKLLFFISESGSPIVEEKSLVFITNRGIDYVPELSGSALTRLYRDSENRLFLAYWPTPGRWKKEETPPMHRELLLENVSSLDFKLIHGQKNMNQEEQLPSFIKLKISTLGKNKKQEKNIDFLFYIPAAREEVIYE